MTSSTIMNTQAIRSALVNGIRQAADVVKSTAGPFGNLVMVATTEIPSLTKDGITALRGVELEDRWEQAAVKLMCDAANRTVTQVGDGTTATTIFTQSLLDYAIPKLEQGASPRAVTEELESEIKAIAGFLEKNTTEVKTRDELYQVALISTNGDAEMANVVADAAWRAGPNGIVKVVDGHEDFDSISKTTGYQVESGMYNVAFSTGEGISSHKDPEVVVVAGAVEGDDMGYLVGAIHNAAPSSATLVIYATNFDDRAMRYAIDLGHKAKRPILLCKLPSAGQTQRLFAQDLAAVAGTKALPEGSITQTMQAELGATLPTHIGRVKSLRAYSAHTEIEYSADVGKHITELEAALPQSENEFIRNRTKDRLARLKGALLTIHVAAQTATEMRERKDRFDDATLACRAAMVSGYSIGGGYNYLRAEKELFDNTREWLRAPMKTLMNNAGRSEALMDVRHQFLENGHCLSLATGNYLPVDYYDVVDATASQVTSIKAAWSIAKLIINCSYGVTTTGLFKSSAI